MVVFQDLNHPVYMLRIVTLLIFLAAIFPLVSYGQQPINEWSSDFAPPGVTDSITSFVEHDNRIYVGGVYINAGSEMTMFAAFDLVQEVWVPIADIEGEGIYALVAAADGSIYVGGRFSAVAGVPATNIARYDPSTNMWSALGSGIDGSTAIVYDLAIGPSGDLYVGGRFGVAGDKSAQNIARWDGQFWDSLVEGGVSGSITSIEFQSDMLYIAGAFEVAGNIQASNIAAYNVSSATWLSLGQGVGGVSPFGLEAMVIDDSGIYIGGLFNAAIQANRLLN